MEEKGNKTTLGGTSLGGVAEAKRRRKKKHNQAAEKVAPVGGNKDAGRKGISKAMASRILQQREEQQHRAEESFRQAQEEERNERERIEQVKRNEEERRLVRSQSQGERKQMDKTKTKHAPLTRYGLSAAPKPSTTKLPAPPPPDMVSIFLNYKYGKK